MTGQGEGSAQHGTIAVSAEVRAVNNRHLKIQTRAGDRLGAMEPAIEGLVRSQIRRGSLQLSVQYSGQELEVGGQIQPAVVESYWRQSQQLAESLGLPANVSLDTLLTLPGAVVEAKYAAARQPLPEAMVELVLDAVRRSLDSLNAMRRVEGKSMALELAQQLARLRTLALAIDQRAPTVVEEYRSRLVSRINSLLGEGQVAVQESDLAREVLLLADKVDIREEIVRLRSHCDQFESLLDEADSPGRKLDFLIQEMFREANTIGSKANDAGIAQHVVEMKTTLEQMRELVQNVE